MIRFDRFLILMGILVVFGGIGDARAVVFQVPGDFGTIQGAIDAAESGDEIIVMPGIYHEVINFNGKLINLHSLSGDPADTIIDGTGLNESVVLCISGEGAGTVLEGFTITGGTGSDNGLGNLFGGGMFNSGSRPTVTNCIFSGNTATHGGGVFNSGSRPTVTNCIFSGNTATHSGGMFNSGSRPTVTNCIFSGNTATYGGGIYNTGSIPTVTNCIFSGNSPWGMFNENSSIPTVTNCTFSGNTSNSIGISGGMRNSSNSTTTVTNCIFWGNSPSEIANNGSGIVTVFFSDIQGGVVGWVTDGGGNIEANPGFVDADGPDNILGTPDDDLRLGGGSQCVDAGNNAAPGLVGMTTDLDGLPRFVDDTGVGDTGNGSPPLVDMGAYERQEISLPPMIFNVPGNFPTIQLAIDAAQAVGDEIIVAPGTYPEVINFLGKAINLHSASGNPADTILDGTGLNESVVLCISGEGSGTILEGFTIRGRTGNTSVFGGNSPKGGGMLNNGSSPTVINCIFSGNAANIGGGMYNTGSDPTVTNCIFSGNTAFSGGGMYNYSNSDPTVTNCTFSGNTANSGGGMYNYVLSNPTMLNCTISGNTAGYGGGIFSFVASNPTMLNCTISGNTASYGGGMFNQNGTSTVTSCTFIGNTATNDGGGMYSNQSNPAMLNCTFIGNTAGNGGGMYNENGTSTVTSCTFIGNTATNNGGGMLNFVLSTPTVTNCTFSGNTATNNGGGMYSNQSDLTVTNCTFGGNAATNNGGGMFNQSGTTAIVTNCILWGDSPNEIVGPIFGSATVFFSDIQDGLPEGVIDGGENIDVDPLFVDADGADNIPGTPDDDLRLGAGSPGVDAGDNSAAGLVGMVTDLDGLPRFVDDAGVVDTGVGMAPIVDMGAYERQVNSCVADILPAGSPAGDGVVDIIDLMGVLNGFGPCGAPPLSCVADITPAGGNGVVNIDDLVAVLNAFGGCP